MSFQRTAEAPEAGRTRRIASDFVAVATAAVSCWQNTASCCAGTWSAIRPCITSSRIAMTLAEVWMR